jgi:hypothetical protein
MFSTFLAIAFAAAQPGPADATTPQTSAAPQGPIVIATGEDAQKLCRALTPGDRLSFAGSAVDRAMAATEHASGREALLQRRYQVSVPATQLGFAPYDAEERTLSLWSHAVPAGAEGAARLALVSDEGLPVRADPATARRIVEAKDAGTLSLEVAFSLPEDEESPCFGLAGAPSSTFAAEPVAWRYLSGDEVLARGGEGADRPLVSVAQGARPRVELGNPVGDGSGTEVRTTAPQHVRDLESCYATALQRDPYLDGAIVAALESGGERVRIAADSVQDEAFVGCVRGVLARVDVSGAGRTWLPIHFVLETPEREVQQ